MKHTRYDRPVRDRRRILLLDGDRRRRRVNATMLRLAGYSVVEGGRVAEVADLLADVDLLMSEAKVDDGDAIEYAASLRRAPETSALPVLIATTDPSVEPRVREALDSMSFFLFPARPSKLLDRVALLLARPSDVIGGPP